MTRVFGWVVVVAACGGGKEAVEGNARIVHGPKGATSPLRATPPLPAVNGRWAITPTSATLTLNSITFTDTEGQPAQAQFENCAPTYVAADAALTKLLDCPFAVPVGEYRGITIEVSTTFALTIDDATNGIYTDPNGASKIVSTPPAGGAQPISLTVPGPGGTGDELAQAAFFSNLLVVEEGTPIEIDLLVDMVHTVAVDIAGGAGTVDLALPVLPATIVPTTTRAGRAAFYSTQGTAANLRLPDISSSGLWGGGRLFFSSGTQPAFLDSLVGGGGILGPGQIYPVDHEAIESVPGVTGKPGGFLGVDSTNTLCWAEPALDATWSGISRICRMALVSSVGQTTSIECQSTSTAPRPTSGATYASGCPALTPNMSFPVTLVAQ